MGRIVGNCNLFIHLNAGNNKKEKQIPVLNIRIYIYTHTYTIIKEISSTISVNES
jgi:hypothetical protein